MYISAHPSPCQVEAVAETRDASALALHALARHLQAAHAAAIRCPPDQKPVFGRPPKPRHVHLNVYASIETTTTGFWSF